MDQILIFGARQHNLKGFDLALPRNRLIVVTGVSGSGKSSLAFDTLFAEGQRRYLDALSTHARHYLPQLDAPLVDEIQGLSPAIAIEQKGLFPNPRSTVGTLTEIHDHLRLLYTRLATPYCPNCGIPIVASTVPGIARMAIAEWPEGSRLLILSPLGPVKERELQKTLMGLRREGYARVRMDGEVIGLDPLPHFPRRPHYALEVVIDRLVLRSDSVQRLKDSLELGLKKGGGIVGIAPLEGGGLYFSELLRCVSCGWSASEPAPSLFSFHHPAGRCRACEGLGRTAFTHPGSTRSHSHADEAGVEGAESDDDYSLESRPVCPECNGSRLNNIARSFKLSHHGIDEVSRLPMPSFRRWLEGLSLSQGEREIALRPMQEILQRVSSLEELGLSYLSLDRSADSLSGGEVQRIRLAHQIGSPLSGLLYILDEPSIGLHPRDHQRLLDILFRLRDRGNTVVVVEHDRETILQADHVVDIGPGAGALGGELLFSGSPADLLEAPDSITGQFLSGRRSIHTPPRRRDTGGSSIRLFGARGHNLKSVDARFPLGCLCCVTGVSGSGKSTLVLDTLYRALAQRLYRSLAEPAPYDRIENLKAIGKVILVDQSPLGRTPRSCPATYTGLFDPIRRLFSQLPESKARGYTSSRFSFNAKGGRCETCRGEGLQRIDMFFLPDVYVTCPACEGTRFNGSTLDIRFKGHSIASILEMTTREALGVFESVPSISHKLDALIEVGLGYLRLGQAATTLSGGEAQRVKLAAELSRRTASHTLFILDEPTTGLHLQDIERLLHVLQRLVDQGHTVILIEHHLDVVKSADYVIDLGPEGGDGGGEIVACGSPEDIAMSRHSHTGRFLRQAPGLS